MNEISVNKLKRVLFNDNHKLCGCANNRLFINNEAFDLIINSLSNIPLYNGLTIWPSLKDCVEYQKRFPLFDVILFYLWLQESNKYPDNTDHEEVLKYIDSFLSKHLVVLNIGEKISDYIKCEEKLELPVITISESLYQWSLQYIEKNLSCKLTKSFPTKDDCKKIINTYSRNFEASEFEASIQIICRFICYLHSRERFSTNNKVTVGFIRQYLSDNLIISNDDVQEQYLSYMYKQLVIEIIRELNHYSVLKSQGKTFNIFLTNNKYWDSVNMYWVSEDGNTNSWPGTKMNYVKTNNMGEDIFTLKVPDNTKLIIFCSENGCSQTVDITDNINNGAGFYLTHASHSGKYEVEKYDYYKECSI